MATTDGKLPPFIKARIDRLLVDLGGPKPLTYQELAERMGMDKGQLSKIVRGRQMVRFDTLQRIAEALDVPLTTLFSESRKPVTTVHEYVSLMTTYHQDLLLALGELAGAGSVSDSARLLVDAERLLRANQAPRRTKRAR